MEDDISTRKLILHIVWSRPGVNHVDLSLTAMSYVNPVKFQALEFDTELANLIAEGEIARIKAVLVSEINERYYFPKGTKFEFTINVKKETVNQERRNAEIDSV